GFVGETPVGDVSTQRENPLALGRRDDGRVDLDRDDLRGGLDVIDFKLPDAAAFRALSHLFGIPFEIVRRGPLQYAAAPNVRLRSAARQTQIVFIRVQNASLIIDDAETSVGGLNEGSVFFFVGGDGLLGPPTVRYILRHALNARDPTAPVEYSVTSIVDPADLAVRPNDSVFHVVFAAGLALHPACEQRSNPRLIVGMDGVLPGVDARVELCERATPHPRMSGIDEDHARGRDIADPEHLLHAVGEETEDLFAGAQGLLGPLEVGDVDGKAKHGRQRGAGLGEGDFGGLQEADAAGGIG